MAERDYLQEKVDSIMQYLPGDDAAVLRDWNVKQFVKGKERGEFLSNWKGNAVIGIVILGIFALVSGGIYSGVSNTKAQRAADSCAVQVEQIEQECAAVKDECLQKLLDIPSQPR